MLCSNCEKEIEEGEEKEVDEEIYCQDCYDEKFKECKGCGEVYLVNELTEIDDCFYCEDCRDEKFFICNDCGNYEEIDSSICVNDDYLICQSCYEDNYFTCDDCGGVFYNDYACNTECGCYCERCYENHDDENRTIHNYHSGNNLQFHKMECEKNVQFAGFELEVECKKNDPDDCAENIISLSDDENLFKLEHDGSLNNGFEIISQPCSLKYFKQKFPLAQIVEKLTADGCVSHNTDTCGLHVHVSRKYLSMAEQIKVGLFIGFNSDKLSRFARRDYNTYCKNNIMKKKGNFIGMVEYSEDRYESVNYKNHRTIEFRLFRGTLKKETIFATLEFCFMLCDFVKTVNFNQIQSADSWKLFCSFIKDKKEVNYLIDYLKVKNIMEV